jgi:hypothetical protein
MAGEEENLQVAQQVDQLPIHGAPVTAGTPDVNMGGTDGDDDDDDDDAASSSGSSVSESRPFWLTLTDANNHSGYRCRIGEGRRRR